MTMSPDMRTTHKPHELLTDVLIRHIHSLYDCEFDILLLQADAGSLQSAESDHQNHRKESACR